MGKGGRMTEEETKPVNLRESTCKNRQSKARCDGTHLYPNAQNAEGLHRKSQARQGYRIRPCLNKSQSKSGQHKQISNSLIRTDSVWMES